MNPPHRVPARTQASLIVEKFGGIVRMAALTGHPRDRIENWLRSGFVPEKHRPGLIAVAHREALDHNPFDYIAYLVTPATEVPAP